MAVRTTGDFSKVRQIIVGDQVFAARAVETVIHAHWNGSCLMS